MHVVLKSIISKELVVDVLVKELRIVETSGNQATVDLKGSTNSGKLTIR